MEYKNIRIELNEVKYKSIRVEWNRVEEWSGVKKEGVNISVDQVHTRLNLTLIIV